jgi:hypothetical protein
VWLLIWYIWVLIFYPHQHLCISVSISLMKLLKQWFSSSLLAAAFVGLGSTPLWTSQGTYISIIAHYHAHHTGKKLADIVSLFFGIFYAFFGTCGIWGNLISYFILSQSNHTQNSNCGVYFDPLAKGNTEHSENVSKLMVNSSILFTICISLLSIFY